MSEFLHHTSKLIEIGQEIIKSTSYSARETGMVDAKGVNTIDMDKILESAFLRYIKSLSLPIVIFSEDTDELISTHPDPKILLSLDPLDGSTNYKAGRGLYLPFGSFFTFYDNLEPSLGNIITAGAVEYTQNVGFIVDEGQTTNLDGKKVSLKDDWKPSRSTPVYLEMFADGYQRYSPLGGKLFIRNQGALVANMSLVLSNAAAAMGGIGVKSEEIGAIYALIKGAGGVIVDAKGRDIGDQRLDHKRDYEILAGNKNVVNFILNTLST